MIKAIYIFILISSLFFSASISKSQNLPIDSETKKVLFQETITIDSISKDELYQRSVNWMTNFFKTNKFDVNEKVNNKLSHEGNFHVSYTYDFKYKSDNTITYHLTLIQKDGRYRYTITDFKIYDVKLGAKTAQPLESCFQKMKTGSKAEFASKFNKEVNTIIEDLKKYMLTGKSGTKDDW